MPDANKPSGRLTRRQGIRDHFDLELAAGEIHDYGVELKQGVKVAVHLNVSQGANIDFFVMDGANLSKFRRGAAFEYDIDNSLTQVRFIDMRLVLPPGRQHFVIKNSSGFESSKVSFGFAAPVD